jgi:hypothetical protein
MVLQSGILSRVADSPIGFLLFLGVFAHRIIDVSIFIGKTSVRAHEERYREASDSD